MLKYEDGRKYLTEQLGLFEAVLALSMHTVAIQHRPKDALEILMKVAISAEVVQGNQSDIE